MSDYSYLGSGKLYLREIGALLGFLEVGNCSALDFSVTEDVKELKDFTQPGGGTYNEVRRISAVECAFTAHDLNAANLARALYGTASAIASATVSGENNVVYPGAFTPFAFLPAETPTPTVVPQNASAAARVNSTAYTVGQYYTPATPNGFYYKVTTAGTSAASPPTFGTTIGGTTTDGTATVTCAGKTTLVAGTDYEIRQGGLYAFADSTLAGESWTCGYTKSAAEKMEALTSSGKEYELLFDGLNEARSGKRTRVWAYRVKAGALANLGLIGEDYAAAECTGKLLKDTSKTGAGISQYFKVEIET